MGPGETLSVLIAVVLPAIVIMYMARRFFTLREKQLDVQSSLAAEKAAQYAAANSQLEQRVRILEQIVTDPGAQTAGQIEALREQARIPAGESKQ